MDGKLMVGHLRTYSISTKRGVIFHIVQVLMKSILQKVDKKDATLFSWSERKWNIVIS